jgi:hypothetical protein
MRINLIGTFVCAFVFFNGKDLLAKDPVPQQGSQSVTVGMPTGASPDAGKNLYSITVYYTDPTGKNTSTDITVPGIMPTAGGANPTAAQVSAASLAKQMAIIAAINAAKIAIQPVTINGTAYNTLTATANPKPEPGGMYPTGKTVPQNVLNARGIVIGVVQVPVFGPADFSGYTVSGITQKVINPGTAGAKLGGGVYRTAGNTITGENGNGKGVFMPGSPGGVGIGGSNNTGLALATFGGQGATTGLSTGMDPSGNPSVAGFGFIDETGSTPVDYFVAFDPMSGMTDADVLTDLSDLFNEDYAADGYTSTYDVTSDILSIDQLLSSADITWSADSDTGLFFEDSMDTLPTPEPNTLLLLGTGLVGLAACFRNGWLRGRRV